VVARTGAEQAKEVAKWILRDLLQALKQLDLSLEASALTPDKLAALLELVEKGRLTPRNARDLFALLVEHGGDPESLMVERGLEAVSDEGALEVAVQEAIDANPKAAESYRAGDQKSLNFLMGQVMKKTQGKADAGTTRKLLAAKLGG
jgi:aspartyl-tRNA(Asn)/glutamyl-tRNA(Gln) amidotransferase subunit B